MWLKYKLQIILALVVLAIGAGAAWYVGNLRTTIADQKSSIVKLELENQIIKDNNAKLEASIHANNEAITKLAAGSDATVKAFNSLNVNVKGQLTGLDSRLQGILKEKKPQSCQETIQYLLDAVPEYNK